VSRPFQQLGFDTTYEILALETKKKLEGTIIYMVIENRNEQGSLTYVYFDPSD
jgi:hypothetical protein